MICNCLILTLVLSVADKTIAQLSCLQHSKVELLKHYDFVVVGAGSAGSVVANRLSEIGDVTVLLLEAGGEEDSILNEIPKLARSLVNSYQDWKFVTELQNSSFFSKNAKKLNYARGKVLGGSSSINFMAYVRGNRRDYDAWSDEIGGGWNWKKVLPYFKKSENNLAGNADAKYHGKRGYLTVTETTVKDSTSDVFLKAANEIGLKTRDINGRRQTGVMSTHYTIRNGERCSANKAFLKSASNRTNLHIVTHAFVKKVALEAATKKKIKAVGVVFQCGKTERTIKANKEVILSAGAISSPHLLLLSGIGPEKQLTEFKIPLKVNLPGVGENFGDHIFLSGLYYINNQTNTESICPATNEDFQSQLLEWSFNRTGRLTSSLGSPDLIGFSSFSECNRKIDWPDTELLLTRPFLLSTNPGDDRAVAGCIPSFNRLKSRGVVRLASADPLAPPIIDPRYLREKSDLDSIIESAKLCAALANTSAMRSAGFSFKIMSYSPCKKYDKSSEEYLRCAVQEMVNPGLHAVGTCKMGNLKDPMAVVDSKLSLYNVTGLRVIDASVVPQVTSGHTNAPAIMIGERGADFIKEFWNLTVHN